MAAGGALTGVLAKAADAGGPAWAADLGSDPAAWVLAVALLGQSAPSVRAAAVRAAVFFAAMSVAYYGWEVTVLGAGPSGRVVALPVAWLVLSATAVPAFAVVVRAACLRRGAASGALLALAAGVAPADGAAWQLWQAATGSLPAGVPLRPVQAAAGVAVALVLTAVLPRHGRTRAVAVVLLVPAAALAAAAVDLLYRALPG